MKKETWFTLFVFIFITAFIAQIPLSIQILGAWSGPNHLEGANGTIAYKMDFLPFGKVYIKMVSSNGRIEKFSARYTVDNATNTIQIDGCLINEFRGKVTKNQLQITSSRYGIPPEGSYQRSFASRGAYLLLLLGLIFLISFLYTKRKRKKQLDLPV